MSNTVPRRPLDSISLASHRGAGEKAFNKQWDLIFWAAVMVLAVVLISCVTLNIFKPDQFTYLARSLSHGHLSVDEMPLIYPDYVVWQGHVYLPFGPMPAILLIPFLPLLNLGLPPGWINIFFTLVNIWLFYQVLRKAGVLGDQRRWILLLFFGGTVYFGMAATMTAWYFSHIVVIFFLLLALWEVLGRRRMLLVGFLVGLAAATRLTLAFSLPFFLWQVWLAPDRASVSCQRRTRDTLTLLVGFAVPLTLILAYNYARFGDMFQTGYSLAVLGSVQLEQARRHGLFGFVHIPRNLYFLLIQGPLPFPALEAPTLVFPYLQPSPMGMSIFLTSPALLLAFRADLKVPLVKACWLSVGCILIPLLTYYGTGWIQFGFRYSLDLMPFLVLIVALGLAHPLSNRVRSLIILSVLINLWGTAWLQHWL